MNRGSSLELALRRAGGTVTEFLEWLTGESIDAEERCHTATHAETPNAFAVPAGHPLLERTVVLRGRRSAIPYVYAESLLVPSRLPAELVARLRTSADPIGRILTDERIAFERVALAPPDIRHRLVQGDDVPTADGCILARSYRVDVSGAPVMVITEWFLSALRHYSQLLIQERRDSNPHSDTPRRGPTTHRFARDQPGRT